MIRWMLIPLVSLTLLPVAVASLAPKPQLDVRKNLPVDIFASQRQPPANDEFHLSTTTEVLLDGRPCRYEEVPDGATILLLETATNESKDILKIHFQTPKRRSGAKSPRR